MEIHPLPTTPITRRTTHRKTPQNIPLDHSNRRKRTSTHLLHRLTNPTLRTCLHPQTRPNILRTLRTPRPITQRIKHFIILHPHKVLQPRRRLRRNNIHLRPNLIAKSLQRQIIRIVAEGVFDLAADGRDAEDYVGADDGAGDGDPVEGVPELEGECEDVDPGYLADGDGVGDWEGGIEDAFAAGEDFVQRGEVAHDHALLGPVVEGGILDDGFDVGG